MIQNKSYKFRIYPTNKQQNLLNRTFGCVRNVWNHNVECFINNVKPLSTTELRNVEDTPYMKEVSAGALQQKFSDFMEYKKQFFNRNRKKKIGKPQFKKKSAKQSYRLPNQKFKLDYDKSKIRLEKIGYVKIIFDRIIPNDAKFISVTISRDTTGEYFASILVQENIEHIEKTNKIVGVDVGIKEFITTSDGLQIKMFNFIDNQNKIKRLQLWLSKKKKDSSRYFKLSKRIAKLHKKIAREREWLHHNLSSYLVKNYDVIGIESLNVSGMLKNHKLAKSISNQGWSEFFNMLKYKVNWYGKEIREVGTFFPSSKTCSNCGNIKQDLTLKDRIYVCECGNNIDRDLNAAINIKKQTIGVNVVFNRSLMEFELSNVKEQSKMLSAIPCEMIKIL